jgi:hypothetical protein
MDVACQGTQAWSKKLLDSPHPFVIVGVGSAKSDYAHKVTKSRQRIEDRGKWAEGQPKLMAFSLVYSSVRSTMLVDAFLLHVVCKERFP